MKTPVRHPLPLDTESRLDRPRRDRDRSSAERGVDVAVVGGGITGTGVALDAASRGLRVVLLEADDLAGGTSGWSSKLVHGGLRYLASGDLAVAWESARERAIVAGRIAPHLIRPMPQLVPAYRGSTLPARLARAGFRAGDALKAAAGPRRLLPDSRWVDAATALRLVPGLRRDGLVGAAVGWDCQLVDDARLVLAVARTAALHGAGILTRAEVVDIDPAGGVLLVREGLEGDTFTVAARWIVNATGVWAGDLDPGVELSPSLGSHVVVPTAALGGGSASLTVPVPGHTGRFVFSLPQDDGLSYVGITDTPLAGPVPRVPAAPAADVEWILSTISEVLQHRIPTTSALGAFAGVRPLAGTAPGSSADISRRHLLHRSERLITITGGKLTTYRRMAADVVDIISDAPCRTGTLGLVGSGPLPAHRGDIPARLLRRYGAEAAPMWDAAAREPDLRAPVAPGRPELGVELLFGVTHEGAVTAADLLHRRTRHGLLPIDPRTERAAEALTGAVTLRG